MSTVLTLASKEIRDGLRNRWVLAATLLLAALALSLTFLGTAPTGSSKIDPLAVSVVSLSSLTIYLIPLIALLLAYDAMVGEVENGTMLLLLAYPVSRGQVVLGKFLGHFTILAFATVVGYGSAGVALGLSTEGSNPESWLAFVSMLLSSALLGAVFLGLGYLVSVSVRERSTAAGVAIVIWLLFVLLYDLALLGVLIADKNHALSSEFVEILLLLNPADAYRMFNLTGFENVSQFAGTAGLTGKTAIGSFVPLGVMVLWMVLPLVLAGCIFRRREI